MLRIESCNFTSVAVHPLWQLRCVTTYWQITESGYSPLKSEVTPAILKGSYPLNRPELARISWFSPSPVMSFWLSDFMTSMNMSAYPNLKAKTQNQQMTKNTSSDALGLRIKFVHWTSNNLSWWCQNLICQLQHLSTGQMHQDANCIKWMENKSMFKYA